MRDLGGEAKTFQHVAKKRLVIINLGERKDGRDNLQEAVSKETDK